MSVPSRSRGMGIFRILSQILRRFIGPDGKRSAETSSLIVGHVGGVEVSGPSLDFVIQKVEFIVKSLRIRYKV